MSGTDELFPEATPVPGAIVPPPPPQAPADPAAASTGAQRRRGLGSAAFVLGLLAILGDLIGIVVALFTLLGAVTNLGQTLTNVDNSLGAFLGVIVLEFLVFFAGILFALLAVILGIVAAARNRGRVLGIFGVIFGIVVLLTHTVLGITVATSGNVPGVTG
jgi:hypothetical protein